MAASISIATCVLLFRYPLMKLFLDESNAGDAIQIGATYLSIIGVAYVIAGIMQSYQNVIRGSGDVNTCMVAGLTELAGRIVFAYLLSSLIGSTGIWIANAPLLELWLRYPRYPLLFRQVENQETSVKGIYGIFT